MNTAEIDVLVKDGDVVVQRWPCRETILPDQRRGVIWRGVAYPILSENQIDISANTAPAETASRYVFLPGEDSSWILLIGLRNVLTAAISRLRISGIPVRRSGRWLGDPVQGTTYDWFVCCAGDLDENQATKVLDGASADDDPLTRVAILEQRLADLRAEPAAVIKPDRSQAADASLSLAMDKISALELELDAARSPRPLAPPGRLQHELTGLLAALRPDVRLLGDSMTVAVGEFQSRTGLWRAIGELPLSGARPEGWKMLRNLDRWWERHVSTGRDNVGRAYARFDQTARSWDFLLGWKSEQARDLAWLKQQG